MRHRKGIGLVDRMADRLSGLPPVALFMVFVASAAIIGELFTLAASLLVTGRVRWNAAVIGLAAGLLTSAATAAFAVRMFDRVAELRRRLEHYATIDQLTGVANRRVCCEQLAAEIARCRRLGATLSIAFVDLDHFKRVNDEFGHLAGDQALREVAQLLKSTLRPYDSVSRYGGEEFVLVLPGTDAGEGCVVAERLRAAVAGTRFAGSLELTISLGVAQLADGMDADRLLRRADEALYRAKSAGRDRCEVWTARP